jgi:hypothetical protein
MTPRVPRSKVNRSAERSYARIGRKDLAHLAELARADREHFFSNHPNLNRLYRNRVLCVALCQGAALHFVDGRNGIKDFDVWTFFADRTDRRFPWRRPVVNADFGRSKFGRNPHDHGLLGRRVDFLMRGIPGKGKKKFASSIQAYLSKPRTKTAGCLAKKAVVIVEPTKSRGLVIWPIL